MFTWEQIAKVPVVCVRWLGSPGFHCGSRGFYVEPGSCVQVLVCKWSCRTEQCPQRHPELLPLLVSLPAGSAPEWTSPLFQFHCQNQRWCVLACPLEDHPRVVIKGIILDNPQLQSLPSLLPTLFLIQWMPSSNYFPKMDTYDFSSFAYPADQSPIN